MSDSAQYRMAGNGVGAPVAEWIARRIKEEQWKNNEAPTPLPGPG
jgi:site-specific DNA-cytosine methylase